jgi:HAD superfamily hydrolase (TIGR01549 family)
MRRKVKAIFFDIGGTLRVTHPEEGRDMSKIQALMSLIGEKSDPLDFVARVHKGEKAYRRWCKPNYIELPEAELWTRFLLPEYPAPFIRENAITINQFWRESKPKYVLPDMVETMRELSRRGYRLGLISNTTSSVEGYQLLEETGLTRLFSSVILSAEFGRRKPHPSLFIEAARRAGVRADECAYVGDRPSRDLIGARQSAYAEVVIINSAGYSPDEYDPDDYDPEKDTHLTLRPDHWIKRLSELLEIYKPIKTAAQENPQKEPEYKLFDVALSTMWHVGQAEPFNETFELMRTIGISRFEFNHQVTPQLLAAFDRNRNYISTVHDPCPAPYDLRALKNDDILISSLDEAHRGQAVDLVKRTLDLAVSLGSRSMVLHTGSLQCDRARDRRLRQMYEEGQRGSEEFCQLREEMIAHRAQYAPAHLDAVKRSIAEIITFAKGSGVNIGVENRYRYYDLPLPSEMQEIIDLCQETWFGFQLDTGHAHALETLGLCEKGVWLQRFHNRIIGVHLHDVAGLTDHQVPGRGDVDFTAVGRFIPPNCQRSLEISHSATVQEISACLEYLEKCACITSF